MPTEKVTITDFEMPLSCISPFVDDGVKGGNSKKRSLLVRWPCLLINTRQFRSFQRNDSFPEKVRKTRYIRRHIRLTVATIRNDGTGLAVRSHLFLLPQKHTRLTHEFFYNINYRKFQHLQMILKMVSYFVSGKMEHS